MTPEKNVQAFVRAAEQFLEGDDRSLEAVQALEGVFAEKIERAVAPLSDTLVELQHALALYSPIPGPGLIAFDALANALRAALVELRR